MCWHFAQAICWQEAPFLWKEIANFKWRLFWQFRFFPNLTTPGYSVLFFMYALKVSWHWDYKLMSSEVSKTKLCGSWISHFCNFLNYSQTIWPSYLKLQIIVAEPFHSTHAKLHKHRINIWQVLKNWIKSWTWNFSLLKIQLRP